MRGPRANGTGRLLGAPQPVRAPSLDDVPADATPTALSKGSPSPAHAAAAPGAAPAGDDLLAVIAHSLLSSVAVIVGGTELLSSHWAELPEDQRTELLVSMRSQAGHVAGVLDNLVRLGDPQLIEVLDGLQHPAVSPPS